MQFLKKGNFWAEIIESCLIDLFLFLALEGKVVISNGSKYLDQFSLNRHVSHFLIHSLINTGLKILSATFCFWKEPIILRLFKLSIAIVEGLDRRCDLNSSWRRFDERLRRVMKLLNLGGVFSIKTNNLATFATKIRAEILKKPKYLYFGFLTKRDSRCCGRFQCSLTGKKPCFLQL